MYLVVAFLTGQHVLALGAGEESAARAVGYVVRGEAIVHQVDSPRLPASGLFGRRRFGGAYLLVGSFGMFLLSLWGSRAHPRTANEQKNGAHNQEGPHHR